MIIRGKSPIPLATIGLVLANILLPLAFDIVLPLIFLMVMVTVIYRWADPTWKPKFGARLIDSVIEHVRVCPYEIFLVVGVIFMTIMPIFHFQVIWYHLTIFMLVALSFLVSELGELAAETGNRGFRSALDLLINPAINGFRDKEKRAGRKQVDFKSQGFVSEGDVSATSDEAEDGDSEEQTDHVLDESSSRPESDQERRWKEWINEELYRLSGGEATFDAGYKS